MKNMIVTAVHEQEGEPPSLRPSLVEEVQEALHFVTSLKQKTFVVKLGGSTLEYQRAVLQDITWLHELGVKVVLV
ncbi:MAG TPA: acetylglutamate kinase, partial [Ktedonobacteraceae bacterium]